MVVMRGYARQQVDALFARIEGTLGRGPSAPQRVTAAEVRAARFDTHLRGYARREVDEALNAAVRELEQRERDDQVALAPGNARDLLRSLAVFPAELPEFDTRSAPDDPVSLFLMWLRDAVRDEVPGPHAMTLATADSTGRVSSRVLICKDVDETGRWYFASGAASVKGRELAANSHAAVSFYWPQQGRQIRIRGTAVSAGSQASAADFLSRPAASRAEALIGRQSEPLADLAELDEAFRRAHAEVTAGPGLIAPGWTLYALTADEVEFWQADHQRRHIRLQYQRGAGAWSRRLLWPLALLIGRP
jgi:pyridoxamine 5'-phosphate oxidase